MKRMIAISLCVPLVLFALALGGLKLSPWFSPQRVRAADKTAKVVILRCSVSGSTYVVTASDASANSPAGTIVTDCSQSLANLSDAGFDTQSAQLEPATGSLVYTLVLTPED